MDRQRRLRQLDRYGMILNVSLDPSGGSGVPDSMLAIRSGEGLYSCPPQDSTVGRCIGMMHLLGLYCSQSPGYGGKVVFGTGRGLAGDCGVGHDCIRS